MMNQQTEAQQDTAPARKTFQRRGILAAAGAVAAGLVAAQVAQPVAALDGDPVKLGTDNTGTASGLFTGISTSVDIAAPWGAVRMLNTGQSDALRAIYNGPAANTAAAFRANGNLATGIIADATGAGKHGVVGSSTNGVGVYGMSNALYGVRGDAGSAPGSAGILGYSNQANGVAFGTVVAAPATTAGYFGGRVVVNGDFAVTGTKSAAVKDATGNLRLMYCVEAPDSWFEDFGMGQLVNGQANILIDPEFAALIHTDAYFVYLTPEGDSKGLYVANKTAAGFAVHEQQGGTSSLSFGWRIVAKRADVKGERLAKFSLPTLKVPDAGIPPSVSATPDLQLGKTASAPPASLPTPATAAPTVQPTGGGTTQPAPIPARRP